VNTTEYQDDISVDDAVALVCTAISAGIDNDLGSGSNVDICIITKDSTKYTRAFKRNVFSSNNSAVNKKHVPLQTIGKGFTAHKTASTDTTMLDSNEKSSTSSDSASSASSMRRQQQQQSSWFNNEVVRPSIVTLHTSLAATNGGSIRKVTDDTIELL
jgi:hypothetical protein